MNSIPRRRLVDAATRLIGGRGCDAVGIAELLEVSKSHRNSLYRHFPKGKTQLMAAVVSEAGSSIGGLLTEIASAEGSPQRCLSAFVEMWRGLLIASDFTAGCPVFASAFAVDAAVMTSGADAFEKWQGVLAEMLTRGDSCKHDDALELASVAISAVEGAVARCRIQKTTQPLDAVERHLMRVLNMVESQNDWQFQ